MQRKKCFLIAAEYALHANMKCMEVCHIEKIYTFTTVETYLLSSNRCETQIRKNY